MTIWQYYIKCWKKYGNAKGRANRNEFWSFLIIQNLVIISFALSGYFFDDRYWYFYPLPIFYASFIPLCTVTMRRLHDIGMSGWWVLVGSPIHIVCFFDSQPGENQYGMNPKETK